MQLVARNQILAVFW